jgi:hypothetical protein
VSSCTWIITANDRSLGYTTSSSTWYDDVGFYFRKLVKGGGLPDFLRLEMTLAAMSPQTVEIQYFEIAEYHPVQEPGTLHLRAEKHECHDNEVIVRGTCM